MYQRWRKARLVDPRAVPQRLNASQFRMMVNKAVGEAWKEILADHRNVIKRAFQSTGLSLASDGSMDDSFMHFQGKPT